MKVVLLASLWTTNGSAFSPKKTTPLLKLQYSLLILPTIPGKFLVF